MQLKLHISNNLEALANCLAGNLKKLTASLRNDYGETAGDEAHKVFPSVFQPYYVISQTIGMNIWLKMQLARENNLGIAANIKFLKSNDLITDLYYALGGTRQDVLPVDHLQWVLFAALKEEAFTTAFPTISAYYKDDDVKRMALAQQMADLFDQYQIYRPELIEDWNQEKFGKVLNEAWQGWLWNIVRKKLGEKMPDKTRAKNFILESLNDPEKQVSLAFRFHQLHVFGTSILTPFHVDLFYKLAQHIDVRFYFLNPAPHHYWLEDKSAKQLARYSSKHFHHYNEGNSLMTGWGKVIRDTFSLFLPGEVLFNNVEDVTSLSPERDTLLQKIQHDIFQNATGENRNPVKPGHLPDDSLTIHSCYTPVREVEVLKDYLLHLIDAAARNTSPLSPLDIVVMVSDIDAYAPFIQSVFDEGPHKIPYTIADRSYSSSDSLLMALETLFAINEDVFSAEEVMQLLDYPLVRDRFSITDTGFLREVVREANIRFGMKGSDADDTIYVSWENGLKRLLFGLCMKDVDEYTIDNDYSIHPVEVAEGSAGFEIVRFYNFVNTLMHFLCERKKEKSIKEWAGYLEELVAGLLCDPDNATGDDLRRIFHFTEKLHAADEWGDALVSFAVFRHYFRSVFSAEKRHADYQQGGVTFCSMIPMRSVPYKVIALLGLNGDAFPRKEKKLNFSLIDGKKPGDRNVKENDKHLFLETLLSAREHLYISYIGQSCKDNSLFPPSILVDELLDYIENGISQEDKNAMALEKKTVRSEMVVLHPLHSFSKKYNQKNSRLYTFRDFSEKNKQVTKTNPGTGEIKQRESITVEEFTGFFKNPFKAFYNKVLNIYYGEDDVLLSGTEMFEPGSLDKWQVKDDLLTVDDAAITAYEKRAVKTGRLPLKNMATVRLMELKEEAAKTKALLQNCTGQASTVHLPVSLTLGGVHLTGQLTCYSNNRQVIASVSKDTIKYGLEAYLRYLMAVVQGRAMDVYLICDGQASFIAAGKIEQKEAREKLEQLMQKYREGQQAILPFFPGAFAEPEEWPALDPNVFKKAVHKEFNPFYSEKYIDPYLEQEYKDGFFAQAGLLKTFQENSALIFPDPKLFQPCR